MAYSWVATDAGPRRNRATARFRWPPPRGGGCIDGGAWCACGSGATRGFEWPHRSRTSVDPGRHTAPSGVGWGSAVVGRGRHLPVELALRLVAEEVLAH